MFLSRRAISVERCDAGDGIDFLESYLEEDFIESLAVFFLDCDENINDTARQLFLHNNTIKYRLKRAQERLGMSFHIQLRVIC